MVVHIVSSSRQIQTEILPLVAIRGACDQMSLPVSGQTTLFRSSAVRSPEGLHLEAHDAAAKIPFNHLECR
jgi:hypothetical protein